MDPKTTDPLAFFSEWFVEPLVVADRTVASIMEAINAHPLADDQSAQDFFLPLRERSNAPGRQRIWCENQENFYCFVRTGAMNQADPPVYFESCLDLERDGGIPRSKIIPPGDGIDVEHTLVSPTFTGFLWHALGHHICLRLDWGGHLAESVGGVQFPAPVHVGDAFWNPPGREFPAGFTCLVGEDALVIETWGAAFRTDAARASFEERYLGG